MRLSDLVRLRALSFTFSYAFVKPLGSRSLFHSHIYTQFKLFLPHRKRHSRNLLACYLANPFFQVSPLYNPDWTSHKHKPSPYIFNLKKHIESHTYCSQRKHKFVRYCATVIFTFIWNILFCNDSRHQANMKPTLNCWYTASPTWPGVSSTSSGRLPSPLPEEETWARRSPWSLLVKVSSSWSLMDQKCWRLRGIKATLYCTL